ncbi:MAG: hypothetical protein CMQ11_07150 [Gammaproteobacteria bacterium]|nr:hypothetical protein [Gammaproteobacteria bacterium]|tara:strand:- start:787 stop:1305 length:519 start_codon:yes stop_codon:yes gene_type:complete
MNSSMGAGASDEVTMDERYMMLVRFNHKFTSRATEWLFALFLVGWCVVLFAFPSMFTAPNTAAQFAMLNAAFGQVAVAFTCGIMGIIRLIALWINGRSAGTPYIRMAMAFFSCFFWWNISLGLVLSGVPTTGWAIYPAILLFEMINVLRAASDARLVYDEKRVVANGTDNDK